MAEDYASKMAFTGYAFFVVILLVFGTLTMQGDVLEIINILTIGLFLTPIISFFLGIIDGRTTSTYGDSVYRGAILGLFGCLLVLSFVYVIVVVGPEGGFQEVRDSINRIVVYSHHPLHGMYDQVIILLSALSVSGGLVGGYVGRYLSNLFGE